MTVTGATPAQVPDVLDAHTAQFVEQFALTWDGSVGVRMEGRIVGLLMILDVPHLSSAQLVGLLQASAGAVSQATRRLLEVGFIKRHVVPGDRNHYFRVEDDIWGSWLASERTYLSRLPDVIATGFDVPSGTADGPRRRLAFARGYMQWITDYHLQMQRDWEQYRDTVVLPQVQDDLGTGEP